MTVSSQSAPLRFAVAISNFNQDARPHRLSLFVGETVVIVDEQNEWFYGYKSDDNTHEVGIFPKCYVHIKESAVIRAGASKEAVIAIEEPIIQEMSTVLREFGAILKHLYLRRDENFEKVRALMAEIMDLRSQVLSNKVPQDELKDLKHRIAAKIDLGNALLGLDLVVRDDAGNILNPTCESTISIYKAHETAIQRIRQLMNGEEIEKRSSGGSIKLLNPNIHNHNLFIVVTNFVCRIGEDADLFMALYDGKEYKFISENYLVRWGKEGLMRDLDQLNNLKVLFSDLGSKDMLRRIFLICQIVRIGAMELKDPEVNRIKTNMPPQKRTSDGLRRPFGVAALDVTEIIRSKAVVNEKLVPFIPCGEKDSLDSVIKKFINTNPKDIDGLIQKHKGQGVWISLHMIDGDLRQVMEEYPHLVSPFTAIARKQGFPDVILPGDVRNDLYLTIGSADFSSRTFNAKNIEVTVRVCNNQGEPLSNVIKLGAGNDSSLIASEYKSVVYYHEDKPRWMETLKITIPIDEFYDSHLKFTFKHRSSNESKDKNEKSFAFAYVKLMNENGTTLRDQSHELLIYKIDNKKFDEANSSGIHYLNLPSTRGELESKVTKASVTTLNSSSLKSLISQFSSNGLSLVPKDSFAITTITCSTKLTQNIDLLGLLKWSPDSSNEEELKDSLYALMQVDGEEIVKFLQDTLDALFNILVNKDSEDLENLVFEALIFIIGLISDAKYQHFRPVLDAYIEENFSATLAYTKLMSVLKKYIESLSQLPPMTTNRSAENLNCSSHASMRSSSGLILTPESFPLKVMKSLEYLFRFIVRSRVLFATLNEDKEQEEFDKSMRVLLGSLIRLMCPSDDVEPCLMIQASCLRYFPSAIPYIVTVYSGEDLSFVLVDLINFIPTHKLRPQKIICIRDIIHTDCLFKNSQCRKILLPVFTEHIRVLMEIKEQMDHCINVLSDILVILHSRDSYPTKDDVTDLMVTVLRCVIDNTISMSRDDPMVGQIVAVMIEIFRQMTPYHYQTFISRFEVKTDLQEFLLEILMVFKDLINSSVFPKECCDMILIQNQVILSALKHFAKSIRENFFEEFDYQLWNNFFHCAIAFMTQQPLQLENFSANKKQKILSRYKDMRREAAKEVRRMWYSLGTNKIRFLPGIVGPFLEMTLIPEIELRKDTIPIFFDMMLCEFFDCVQIFDTNSNPSVESPFKGHFKDFEHEMISQLDILVEGGRGDESFKELFEEILKNLCEDHPELRDQGLKFVRIVSRLMKRLLEYRQVSKATEENRDVQMISIVNLLQFYNEIDRKEMYIRYLHKLSDLHLVCENYTEAACVLLFHSKLLKWSDESLSIALKNEKYPDCETHRELKERLCLDIIDYFDKGKLWERGISICKELAHQYENEIYDYQQLAVLHQRMATFFDNILKQVRLDPEYFRVSYYGHGFPLFLRNKTFVYRGKECEKLDDFQAKHLTQFPQAHLLTSLSMPTEDIIDSAGQYLLINKVDPAMQPRDEFKGKDINDQILKYYKVNDVRKFTFSKMIKRASTGDPENEFSNLWIERTTIVTSSPLPGLQRASLVRDMSTDEISPIQNAVDTIEGTNKELTLLIRHHLNDAAVPLHPLTMRLNGVIDAAVNGGIPKYEKAFLSEKYLSTHVTRADYEQISKLKAAIAAHVPILAFGIQLHAKRVPPDMRPLHMHMENSFNALRQNLEAKYGKSAPPKELVEKKARTKRSGSLIPPVTGVVKSELKTPKRGSMSVWVGTNSVLISGAKDTFSTLRNMRKQVQKTDPSNSDKKEARKSKDSSETNSQWYVADNEQSSVKSIDDLQRASRNTTTSISSLSLSNSNSHGGTVIELSQSLVSQRPLRPEAERRSSRPASASHLRSSPSRTSFNSNISINSNSDIATPVDVDSTPDEPPPPLPSKTHSGGDITEYTELTFNGSMQRHRVLGNRTRKPLPPLPSDGNSPEVSRRFDNDRDLPPKPAPRKTPPIPQRRTSTKQPSSDYQILPPINRNNENNSSDTLPSNPLINNNNRSDEDQTK